MTTLTVHQMAQALRERGLDKVTYRRVYGACLRGECPYVRVETRIRIDIAQLSFLESWFREQDRMKEKEAVIGKWDITGRRTLRAMGQDRVREGDIVGGQADTPQPPG